MAVFVDKLLIALGIDPRGAEQGLDRVNHSVDRTDAKLNELKHKASGVARSIAMQVAGPLLAAFSVGKMVQGYISDVAQVAEQTGAYNKKLEEERLKKAQLQRVTKEDIELYKRGREAFVKFQIAMSDFGAKLMRTLMPFVKDLLDKLNRFTDWISHNSNNIIRFLTILASTITLALIPAVVKFTATLLKNPLVWVVGLVLALALAIDDLIVYLKGGRSEFDAFWKWLGLTKGDTETLTKAINWLKTSGVELLKTIGKVTAAFVAMRAVASVLMIVQKAWNALSLSILANPIILAIGLLIAAGWMLYKNWDGVCEGIAALLETLTNAWQKAVDWTADLFQSIDDGAHALVNDAGEVWDGLVNRVSHTFELMGNILSAFHDAASEKMAAAGNAIGGAFTSALNTVSGVWQGMKEGATAVGETIADAFATAVSAISDSMAWAGEKIDEGLTAIGDFASDTWQGIKDGASALAEDAGSAFGAMGAAVAPALGWIADKASGVWQSVSDGAVSAGNAMLSAFDSAKSGIGGVWQGMEDGVSALVDGIENAFSGMTEWFSGLWDRIAGGFTSALNTVNGVWQGMKEGASALVDDIEDAFSGLTQWFSALWGKITGIFDRALGKIKGGISSVTDALGITDSKHEEREELAEHTPTDPEFERQKAAIIEMRRSKTGSYDTDDYLMQHPARRPGERNVTKGTLRTADKVKALQEQMTAFSVGMQKAAGVKAAPVNSGSVSNVRNTTQKSTINNDNRRQEVNITVNGNADTKTVGQIKDGVTGVFAQGAASPVMG